MSEEIMLMYTMLRRLAGTSLQRCRVNDVQQRKQRSRLTIGSGIAVIILILLCTVACGSSDGALAKGGINMIVLSGQAKIQQSNGGNTSVVEGQEAVLSAGDQITADEAGVKLLLADGSLLRLNPDTDLQVVTFSAKGTARLSQLKGRLEVEGASPLLTVEISTSVSDAFALKTMQFTVTPAVRDTTFRLWIDGDNAHLTVEAGEVNVTNDDRMETIPAGGEVKPIPGEGLEVILPQTEAPVKPTATPDPSPTIAPRPSPTATATVAPKYPAPGLHGPGDGDDFKPNDDILLIWGTPTPLLEDEWYEVQLWREGEPSKVVQWVKEGTWKVGSGYYPGRYQWRIVIVRGQDGRKEMHLSPPSQTWSFSWLRPSPGPTPTAPTSLPVSEEASVDLTIYLRGINNAQGFVALSGEHIDAGPIYTEGRTVYGDVAVRVGDTVYHFNKPTPEPGKPEQLPDPYRLEFEFSDPLVAATEGDPWFDPRKAQFSVGKLDCNSDTLDKSPYEIEMTLYAGEEIRKQTVVSLLVGAAPSCGVDGGESEEGGGGGPRPPRRPGSE
jgi:hypothetical protein